MSKQKFSEDETNLASLAHKLDLIVMALLLALFVLVLALFLAGVK